MTGGQIFSLGFAWIFLGAIVLGICAEFNLSTLNPIRNYKKWNKMNLFGVIVTTLILNIIFFPYAIIYWMIYKLFTVGRRQSK